MTDAYVNSDDKAEHLAKIRIQKDPYLKPFKKIITRRLQKTI